MSPDDVDRAPAPSSQTCGGSRSWLRAGTIFCISLGIFSSSEYLTAAILVRHPFTIQIPASILGMLAVALILTAAGGVIRLIHHWVVPARRLRDALEGVVENRLPIERVPSDLRGLSHLAPVVQMLLKELRSRRAEVASLNLEMSQRVAQRTDALERKMGSLRAQATRDALTGLYNRRMFDDCLDALVVRCREQGQDCCLLMIDVDDFKLLNDTLGHGAGDDLLKNIGQLIRSTIRQHDLAFRCGGDEFVVLMPGSGLRESRALARRLGDLVERLTRPLAVPRAPRLSIGAAAASELSPGQTPQELISEADKRLYEAKAAAKARRGAA